MDGTGAEKPFFLWGAGAMDAWRYLLVLIVPVLTALGLWFGDVLTWAAVIFVFGLIPLVEVFLRADSTNADDESEAKRRPNRLFDWVLVAMVPVQYAIIAGLLWRIAVGGFVEWELAGAIASVGLCCGGVGINVAHELGHRTSKFEQMLAKMLLLTSLYMHFFIEHNRGHHSRVATDDDPASARRGETLYAFWLRSVIFSFASAWQMEWKLQKRRGFWAWGWRNEMVRFVVLQAAVVVAIGATLGIDAMLAFLGAAAVGILLLETVNYIEHYGLRRQRRADGKLEPVEPAHSWNSDHPLGRLMLFELSRHSDHHAHPKRPYQLLRSLDDAPQLPTGYPGMMLLSLVPPLFFAVMHPRLDRQHKPADPTALAGAA